MQDRIPETDINKVNRNSGVGSVKDQLANLDSIFKKTASVLLDEKIYTSGQIAYIYDLAKIWTLGGWVLNPTRREELLGFDFESFPKRHTDVKFTEEEREHVRKLAKDLSKEAKGLKNVR